MNSIYRGEAKSANKDSVLFCINNLLSCIMLYITEFL